MCEHVRATNRSAILEEEAREAIAASRSYPEALRRLGMRPAGGNHTTIRKYAECIWRIPIDHFDTAAARARSLRREPIPLEEVVVVGSYYSRRNLKLRLYQEGLKQRACELCGQGEIWRGERMSLILDHVNGVADEKRFENLRIVCHNCAATFDTHCGRNLAVVRICEVCGNGFRSNGAKRHCSRRCGSRSSANRAAHTAARRVPRPSDEVLIREINSTSVLAVGRRYGVSDNAVRKWLRSYESLKLAGRDSNPGSQDQNLVSYRLDDPPIGPTG